MPKQYDAFRLIGGLDLNTPYLERSPGSLIGCLNYEPDPDGGYRRIPGYERFDGRQSPTDSVVTAIPVQALIDPVPSLGDVITGSNSNATGRFVSQDEDDMVVFVTNATGQYTSADTISGVTVAGDSQRAAFLVDNDKAITAYRAAREYNRSQIQAVPGSGPVRAAYEHNGVVYAIRDNVGATAANIYRSTTNGWQIVDLSTTALINFDNGQGGSSDPIAIGNVVTGATSNATGTVSAIGIQDAARQAGYIVVKNLTGTFQDNENLQVGGRTVADVNGAPQTPSINAGGTYKIVSFNFYGGTATDNMYLVNGQQTALQFDGDSIAPVFTGLPSNRDRPFDVSVHYNQLFLAFDGGSLQHSVVGEPLNFRGDLGASEFALGSNITNLIVAPRALVVTTRDNIRVIYGRDPASWELAYISQKAVGAIATGQYLARPLVIDRAGVIGLDRVEAFGNFQDALVSDNVRSLVNRNFARYNLSSIDKFNNHYYVYADNGENLLTGFANNNFIGYFPINYAFTVQYASANESRLFITSTEGGFVYENRKGTSFDGNNIESFIILSYAFQGQPQRKKRYRRATISLQTFLPRLQLRVAFTFSKGTGLIAPSEFDANTLGGGGRWDVGRWDEIVWDGQDVPEIISDIDGVGTDVSMTLFSDDNELDSFIVEDVIYEYSPRAIKR